MPWKWERFLDLLANRMPTCVWQHFYIVILTMLLAMLIALPISVLLTRPAFRKFTIVVMSFLNVLQSIPSLALLALAMPLLGIGLKPALTALTFLSIMPIAKNTIAGLDGVDVSIKEAAQGMGMTPRQVLREVELPLAMPVIMTGIRTSAVLAISSATLASVIGSGGLGDLIYLGLLMNWKEPLLIGAGLSALIAALADLALNRISLRFVPPGATVEN
jgi:osmoprotectant transport system permease protein